MGRKHYVEDLKAATSGLALPNVDRIRKGDADYSIALTYTHPVTSLRLDISLVPSEVSDYPSEHTFFIWTDSDNVPASAVRAIESLSMGSTSATISSTIRNLGSSLTSSLNPDGALNASQTSVLTDADGDSIMEDFDVQESELDDFDDDDDEFDDGFGDDDFGLGPVASTMTLNLPSSTSAGLHAALSASAARRIKNDLKQTRDAGYRVAPIVGLVFQSNRSVVSISKRVARLGLSDDTLHAWGISSDDYIVLLVSIIGDYLPFEKAKDAPAADTMKAIEFRIGRCRKHKPSKDSATMAFQTTTQASEVGGKSEGKQEQDDDFMPIFLSNSLAHFINHEFISMVKIRANNPGLSWADATKELELQRLHIGTSTALASVEESNTLHDHLATASTRKESSLPLIAMEFAIHYTVRCTDYCLVCHQKLPSNFQALRPYVCEQPLCLFQYMNLGFGPNAEHEVVEQPYTVDLLVSFCYAALTCMPAGHFSTQKPRIRDFPAGLRLKVPQIFAKEISNGSTQAAPLDSAPPDTSMRVAFSAQTNTGTMELGNAGTLGVGQWVAVLYGRVDKLPATPIANSTRVNVYVGRVSYVLYNDFELDNITVMEHSQLWGHDTTLSRFGSRSTVTVEATGPEKRDSLLVPFDHDVDDLGMAEKMTIGRIILNTIPLVMEMRDYLLSHPHRNLASFERLSPAAFGLLRWIISSNRSCITLIHDPSNVTAHQTDSSNTQLPPTSAAGRSGPVISSLNAERYRIGGMGDWVQFRFLQGSPEKERRFVSALSDSSIQINANHPTIFAWHGSCLSNWHSIVRTGLDFQETHHGRAYGNGVYMSPDYATSMGYSGGAIQNPWINSALKFSSTIALCEVINAPLGYVSVTPHYVVNQIDWIQCRYLFVSANGAERQHTLTSTTPAAAGNSQAPPLLQQCPSMECRGQKGILDIPRSAAVSLSSTSPTRSTFDKPLEVGYTTDPEDEDDADFFAERTSLPATPVTDFTPGSLKLNDIITLAPPSYATDAASKAIARELKTMREEMETKPLHELGWYVDLESVENMFQLIVELHSFDLELPIARDMNKAGVESVVLEMRFGRNFPMSPPFIRVMRPRFLPFQSGGGGHVTIGGAICMELLTNSGWSPACSLETVLVQVRAAICSTDPPARLANTVPTVQLAGGGGSGDYGIREAVDAYERYARTHGWEVPLDIKEMVGSSSSAY